MHSLWFYRQPDSASLVLFRSLRTRGALLFGQRRHPLLCLSYPFCSYQSQIGITVNKIREYMEEQKGRFNEADLCAMMVKELTTTFP